MTLLPQMSSTETKVSYEVFLCFLQYCFFLFKSMPIKILIYHSFKNFFILFLRITRVRSSLRAVLLRLVDVHPI